MSRNSNRPHYVYRCFDTDGALLYVGVTVDLPARLATHQVQSPWAPLVSKVRAKVYAGSTLGRAAERKAILTEHPRWNTTGRWAGRHTWARDDWHSFINALVLGENNGASRPSLAKVRDGYQVVFGEAAPQILLSAIDAQRQRAAERARSQREEMHERLESIRRQDELALRRDRQRAAKRRAGRAS